MTTDVFLLVEESMGADIAAMCVERFVAENPQFDGATWADILDAMDDADAYLAQIETAQTTMDLFFVLEGFPPEEFRPFYGSALRSAVYANPEAAAVDPESLVIGAAALAGMACLRGKGLAPS